MNTSLRQGNLVVALTRDAYSYNHVQFTLEVTEMAGDEGLENDADVSGLRVDASESQVAAYLEAAMAVAVVRAGPELNVRNVAGYAAVAGVKAVQALGQPVATEASDWTPAPRFCPYCGGAEVREVGEWEATSADDPENIANVKEYQCEGACQGRSFWS